MKHMEESKNYSYVLMSRDHRSVLSAVVEFYFYWASRAKWKHSLARDLLSRLFTPWKERLRLNLRLSHFFSHLIRSLSFFAELGMKRIRFLNVENRTVMILLVE